MQAILLLCEENNATSLYNLQEIMSFKNIVLMKLFRISYPY